MVEWVYSIFGATKILNNRFSVRKKIYQLAKKLVVYFLLFVSWIHSGNLLFAVWRTDNIGHLIYHGSNFINFYENKLGDHKIYWFTDKSICNHYIYRVFKKLIPSQIKVIHTPLFFRNHIRKILVDIQNDNLKLRFKIINTEDGFFEVPRITKWNSAYIRLERSKENKSYFDEQTIKLLSEQKSILNFQKQMKDLGINPRDEVVLVIDRDSSYRKEKDVSPRDTDPSILHETIQYLLDLNFYVVRFGSKRKNKVLIKSANFLDYPFSSFRTEKADYLLGLRADYVFSWNTGLNLLTNFQRKRICLFDYTYVIPNYYNILVSPKNYIFLDNNEIVFMPYMIRNYQGDVFDNSDLMKNHNISNNPTNFKNIKQSIQQFIYNTALTKEELSIERKYFKDLSESLIQHAVKYDQSLVPNIYINELLNRKNILSSEFCQRYGAHI